MKKTAILFILTMILAGAAHADWLGDCLDGAFGGDGPVSGSALCAPVLISTLPISPLVTTTEGANDDRAIFIQQVRDDAAEYVAADGQEAASAVLNEAIDATRAKYPQAQKLDDMEIAKILMN